VKDLDLERERGNRKLGPQYFRPTHTLAPFANDSLVLKKFVQMGVQVHQWEGKEGIPEFILKLNFNKDVTPYLR
jgi:mTERF domain-containing protein